MPPEPELIEAIATDLGVDPSFVEKDWYAIRLVATIINVKQDNLTLVFSGGTSLSKGYSLIRRFSEDLDFKAPSSRHRDHTARPPELPEGNCRGNPCGERLDARR